MAWRIKWTQEKKDAVCKELEQWLKKYCPHYCAGESIMQSDDPQIYAPELISDIVDNILEPIHEPEH